MYTLTLVLISDKICNANEQKYEQMPNAYKIFLTQYRGANAKYVQKYLNTIYMIFDPMHIGYKISENC